MSAAVLQLDDTRITLASRAAPGEPVYAEPAFCWIDGDQLRTGNEAFAVLRQRPREVKDQYVFRLTTQPLADRRFSRLTPADLLAEQIESAISRMPHKPSELVICAPGYMGAPQLGIVLGICQSLGLPVVGLCDQVIAATRSAATGLALLQVNLGLHAAIVSVVDQTENNEAQLLRHDVIENAGVLALRTAVLQTIAAEFVKQSRFDPLHNAQTEQLLEDRLDSWLALAESDEQVECALTHAGADHRAVIPALDLLAAFSSRYQLIVDGIRAAHGSGQSLVVQLGHAAARFPGLEATIKARTGATTVCLEADAATIGAAARYDDVKASGGSRLVSLLPLDAQPMSVMPSSDALHAKAPTHLLATSEAFAIQTQAISIGSGELDAPRRLQVAGSAAGVSRNHCTVKIERGQCVVSDHSRYGTFLNGNRINGSAILQTGDVLRVGTPGIEYALIRVVN